MTLNNPLLVAVILTGLASGAPAQGVKSRAPTTAEVRQNIAIGRCSLQKDRTNSSIIAGFRTRSGERKAAANKFMSAFNECALGVPVAFPRIVISGIASDLLYNDSGRLIGKLDGDLPSNITSLPTDVSVSERFAACLVEKDRKDAVALLGTDFDSEAEHQILQILVATGGECGKLPDEVLPTAKLRAEVVIALYRRAEAIVG